MAGLDDLSRGELADILRRLRVLETASPLQNASIGSNGLRVYDGGVITIQNGGLNVTGTATITGTLQADGTITFTGTLTQSGESTFTGPTHFDGPTDVTGNFDVDGPMTTTGTLDVEGVTNLKNDVNVTGGGKIKAGGLTIDPSVSGGSIVFSGGGGVQGGPGPTLVKGAGNAGFISDTTAAVFAGASQLTVGDGYVKIDGLETVSGVSSNLYMDPSTKRIKRIV
jgi:hypothetical protein